MSPPPCCCNNWLAIRLWLMCVDVCPPPPSPLALCSFLQVRCRHHHKLLADVAAALSDVPGIEVSTPFTDHACTLPPGKDTRAGSGSLWQRDWDVWNRRRAEA